jgi:signal transduction histidine kinase
MSKMVKKLLDLNQIEFGESNMEIVRFDIVEMIQGIVASTDILFKQKGVDIEFNRKKKLYVWADQYMIEEVLTNYISNALNHVDDDKKIKIEIKQDKEAARICVFNSGKPIPESDIDRIWEKFYKVDKSRTREYGGNGVGLSIVKAIMEKHDRKYGVNNLENGVEFWFELDIKA